MASAVRFLPRWKLALLPGVIAVLAAGEGFAPQSGGGATAYRFAVGCYRPVCRRKPIKDQQFQFSD